MTAEFLRIDFQLVYLLRDEDGTIIGEEVATTGMAFPAGLDSLPDSIRDAVNQINAESTSD